MLHDLYAYENGTYEDHARKGAELAEKILTEMKLTSEEETGIHLFRSAIMMIRLPSVLRWTRC